MVRDSSQDAANQEEEKDPEKGEKEEKA